MKHAFLIIAHQDFQVLETLIEMLDYPNNDIFVHLDRKVHYRIKYKPKKSALYLVPDDRRVDVRWGDCSQIWSELVLYRCAFENGPYDYYHLMSGIDLPIKSQSDIHAFFEKNEGKIFLGLMQDAWRTKSKIAYYHILTRNLRGKSFTDRCGHVIHWLFTQVQKVLHIERDLSCFPELKKGANWCSLPNDAVAYLMEKETWIRERFKYTYAADEVYKASVLYNSHFRERFYSKKDEYEGCLRLVDWTRGNPYVWTISDWDEIMGSNKLFARKFSSEHLNLVLRLKDYLKNKE